MKFLGRAWDVGFWVSRQCCGVFGYGRQPQLAWSHDDFSPRGLAKWQYHARIQKKLLQVSLVTAWRLLDDCLTTAWWKPDNCLMTAWQLPETMMTLVPEARQNDNARIHKKVQVICCLMTAWWLSDDCLMTFYRWASCMMEPWDGPALLTFSNGRFIGAVLDWYVLRPSFQLQYMYLPLLKVNKTGPSQVSMVQGHL